MIRYMHIAVPLAMGAALVLLAGCAQPEVEAARNLTIEGRDAASEAAREYRRLAVFEDKMMWDRASARAFSEKALAAADGRLSKYVPPTEGGIEEATKAEIDAAYKYLNRLRDAGADDVVPKAAGQAVARLDCWAEQAIEGDQPKHIKFCRDGYRAYADQGTRVLKAVGRDIPGAPAALRSFSVPFALGSATPLPEGAAAIRDAARYAKALDGVRIVLGGHADRSGSPAFNQRLSKARAETVARLLREGGVAATHISVIGFGETYPRSQTPDGQKSAVNRRVEIVIGPDRLL